MFIRYRFVRLLIAIILIAIFAMVVINGGEKRSQYHGSESYVTIVKNVERDYENVSNKKTIEDKQSKLISLYNKQKFLEDLQEKFKKTRRLIEVFEFGRQHPEMGGSYWSYQISLLCSQYSWLTLQVKKRNVGRISAAALQDLSARCEGVPSTPSDQHLLAKNASHLGDLKAQEIIDLEFDRTRQGYTAWIAALLQSGDFITLAANGDDLFYSGEVGGGKNNLYFDGRWYRNADAQMLILAAGLAACKIGFPCGDNHYEVEFSCVVQKECASSYEQLIEMWVERNNFNKNIISELSSKIARAFKNGELKKFLPPG